MNFADKNYKKVIIQRLLGGPELLTVYCVGTNMPLVECSQETFNDRTFVFSNEDLLKAFVKPYFEKKMPLKGIKFPAKDRMKYFSTLLMIHVDELVYIDHAGRHVIPLSDFVRKQDFSNVPPHKRPVENPQLQLSGLYFVQEASRAVPAEEKEHLRELEEELAANLVKGIYILPAELIGEAPQAGDTGSGQFKIPMIKTPQGELFVPIFTDHMEFAKYNQNHQCKALVVPFANLQKMLVKEAKGYMINPNGFHIRLTEPLLKGLIQRFGVKE